MSIRKPMVAILGCGPTGLLAAHACRMRSVPFVIFSRKQKSKLGGAQFSHIPIPGIHEPEASHKLTYIVEGDAATYAQKVYGGLDQVPFVSFDNVSDGMVVEAWPLVQTYDRLWEWYSGEIVDVTLDPLRVMQFSKVNPFDITFCSIHATQVCLGRVDPSTTHFFQSQAIRILNEPLNPNLPDMTIQYDGTKEHSYYRMSKIFGVGSTEWGARASLPPGLGDRLINVNKPIGTNCDCHEEAQDHPDFFPNLIKIGRFGTWKKGVLTMHAYNTVIDALARMGVQ